MDDFRLYRKRILHETASDILYVVGLTANLDDQDSKKQEYKLIQLLKHAKVQDQLKTFLMKAFQNPRKRSTLHANGIEFDLKWKLLPTEFLRKERVFIQNDKILKLNENMLLISASLMNEE
mmetsp:Transcript_3198/g.5625  ORF Transcript_3198/g.5625 Transcript_3198/m.5625 type:complete len:121 (+) Transcript_3198:2309-2671(+)